MVQVFNDGFGFVHPDGFARFFNAQARDFDLASFIEQCLTIHLIVFGIAQRDRHIEAMQRATSLDAEGAGVELIQGQVLSRLFNGSLSLKIGRASCRERVF